MSEIPLLEPQSSFTHEELLKITSSVLTELLSKDSYLSDLPGDVTFDEINNEVAVLHGKSITVYILIGEEMLPVIIPQSGSRVSDLKRAIRRSINLKLLRSSGQHGRHKVSWRYVWRTYQLECDGAVMKEDNALLSNLGVVHKSRIAFVKRRRKTAYNAGIR